MDDGRKTQVEEVQELPHELFKMYINLTSILLEYGYGYLIEFMPESDVPALIQEVTNAINKIEAITKGNSNKMENSNSLEEVVAQKAADLQTILNNSQLIRKQMKTNALYLHTDNMNGSSDSSMSYLPPRQNKTKPLLREVLQNLSLNTNNFNQQHSKNKSHQNLASVNDLLERDLHLINVRKLRRPLLWSSDEELVKNLKNPVLKNKLKARTSPKDTKANFIQVTFPGAKNEKIHNKLVARKQVNKTIVKRPADGTFVKKKTINATFSIDDSSFSSL